MADAKKEPLDGSDASSGEESSTGSISASSSPGGDASTKDSGAQATASEKVEHAGIPNESAADDSEEEGAVHSPEPTPQLTLTEDISEDALEAAPTLPPKKPKDSRPLEPIEGELDFEDDTPTDDPLQSGGDECLTKEQLGDSHQSKDENLEEGEAEDDGEVSDVSGTELSAQDDDLEEGELQDGTSSGSRKAQPRPICRFFNKGQCTWGTSCRFIHPGVNDRGNYNMFAPSVHPPKTPASGMPPITSGAMMRGGPALDLGPPLPPLPPPLPLEELPLVESAWERGLRHAKELMKRATRRKEQEPDFEDKRLNLGLLDLDKENTDYYLSGGAAPPQCPPQLSSPPYHHERGERVGGHRRYNMDVDGFYGYEESEQLDHAEREAREYWRGGRGYENFEVRWNRPEFDHRERREKDRRFGRSYEGRDSTYGNYPHNQSRADRQQSVDRERWREERFSEVQPSSRSRPDEWRDPWRRSKTPKGRQSRSRGRNRRSFSGCSSRSFSSRTSRSSYSYSRSSSSRSSYYSSERSYSRGGTRSHSRSRSRSRSPLAPPLASRFHNEAPHPPRYPQPSQSPSSNKPAHPVRVSPVLDRRKVQASPPLPAAAAPPARNTVHKKGPSDTSRQTKSRSGSYTGSSSSSHSRSSSSRTPSRSRSRSYSRSRSISIDSVSSASSSSVRRPGRGGAPVMARNPSPPKKPAEARKRPAPPPTVSSLPLDMDIPLPPMYREPVSCVPEVDQCENKADSPRLKELVKQQQQLQQQQQQIVQHKPQIKLTLIKKSLPLSMMKKEETPAQKNGDKASRKRSSPEKTPGPPSDESPPQGGRRSTTLRREELLKQLKAVEDAIARKRAKFN